MKSGHALRYLSRRDVEEARVSMPQTIDVIEKAFRERARGMIEMPPKPGVHPRPDAFIHAMPAYVPALEVVGIKWVSGYPENQSKGLPYISGLLVMNNPDTGFPKAIMDCTWITATRTGAATAVAAKCLARKNSSSVGIVACGVQGRSNLEALVSVFPIKEVKAYDLQPEIADRFAEEMGDKLQVKIEPVRQVDKAVKEMDIVVTSGPILKKPKPEIEAKWLSEGAFASLVDFDSCWHGDALREADKLATDDIEQMNYYREEGYFRDTPEAYADLGEILAGVKPGRENAKERTIAINLGVAFEDIVTASLVYEKALEKNLGRDLPL
jgi:ornithine cyclodeaminase/alanine dehydrogenase-like protein (mu-crystallin family)